jgi:hypothetical protein
MELALQCGSAAAADPVIVRVETVRVVADHREVAVRNVAANLEFPAA